MDKYLLNIIVCPSCRGKLELNKRAKELRCKAEQLAYPIRDNIPILLMHEARKMEAIEGK